MSERPVRPKAPEPMHFGLNTVMVEQLVRDTSVKKVAGRICSAACILGIALIWSVAQEERVPLRVAVPSVLALMATVVFWDQIPKFRATRNLIRSGADPIRVGAFQEATREYEAQLKEYEKSKA